MHHTKPCPVVCLVLKYIAAAAVCCASLSGSFPIVAPELVCKGHAAQMLCMLVNKDHAKQRLLVKLV